MKQPLDIRSEGPSLGPEGLSVQHLPGPIEPIRGYRIRILDWVRRYRYKLWIRPWIRLRDWIVGFFERKGD